MNIAKIIREGRERLNLNQTQLAELVGVSPQAVQQWESGATLPRGKRLNRIAEVLQLPPSVMHFGQTLDAPQAVPEKNMLSGRSEASRSGPGAGPEAASGASRTAEKKPAPETDALISQVVEAMRRMSKEDAARLVTISKALVSAASVQAEALQEDQKDREDLKPLPAPDLPAHPQPAFPPRRMPEGRTKVRGKTASR